MSEVRAWLGVVEALKNYMDVTEQDVRQAGAWDYASGVAEDIRSVMLDIAADMVEEASA
jgi:hypothetical protein